MLWVGFWEEHEFWGWGKRIGGWIERVLEQKSRQQRSIFFSPNWIKKSRLGELNPKFVLLCVFYVFDRIMCWNWWCMWWKLGVVNLAVLCFEFWTKCMKKRGYTWYLREWGGNLEFGEFLESMLRQCDVVNCVNWFGMIELCLVCCGVRIEQSWSESSAWSVKESAILAQASLARLGEISKVAHPIAIRASRSSEVDGFWAT